MTTIYIAAAIGCLLYFMFEFGTKKKLADFKFATWVSGNWFNVILTPIVLYAYLKYVHSDAAESEAFFIGFGVNKIVDYFQDIFTKNKA